MASDLPGHTHNCHRDQDHTWVVQGMLPTYLQTASTHDQTVVKGWQVLSVVQPGHQGREMWAPFLCWGCACTAILTTANATNDQLVYGSFSTIKSAFLHVDRATDHAAVAAVEADGGGPDAVMQLYTVITTASAASIVTHSFTAMLRAT